MSIKLFSNEILRFLKSDKAEVLCITGKWGVGKTFAWDHFLREAQNSNSVAFPKYAYVSLFGRNSLDDLRAAIVEETVDSKTAGLVPDLKSFDSVLSQAATGGRGIAKLLSYLPNSGGYAGAANRVLFLGVQKQIVCIDDIERAGPGLDLRNVLGLVSHLKERRNCKVVILLNQEKLIGDGKTDFAQQLEKVADTVISFEPTADESAQIGVDHSNPFHAELSNAVKSLSIVNIRVIKKIERFCLRLSDLLLGADERVLKQAVRTAALAGFSRHAPGEAPPLDYIKSYNGINTLNRLVNGKGDESKEKYREILRRYNFQYFDEFDAVIVEGVERGYLDDDAVRSQASILEARIKKNDQESSFNLAWRKFHDSFDDDQDQVLDELAASVKENVDAISAVDLNSTIVFLKDFSRTKEAEEALNYYVDHRHAKVEFWNLRRSSLGSQVTDPDVRAAFERKFQSTARPMEPEEILRNLIEERGWRDEYFDILSAFGDEKLAALFRKRSGEELKKIVQGALFFKNVSNADERMKELTKMAERALRRIALDSPMNVKRVRNFGVDLELNDKGES